MAANWSVEVAIERQRGIGAASAQWGRLGKSGHRKDRSNRVFYDGWKTGSCCFDGAEMMTATLQGRRARLVPMEMAHHAALCEVGLDERLWARTTIEVRTPEEMREYMTLALEAQSAGTAL